MARVRVGISGWRYPPWRGVFYPAGLPQRAELAYAAERLDSVELNGSFYSLQRPSSYRSWAEQVPADFVLAVKGGRFITHMKKLAGVDTALANFLASGPLALGARLGPLLWQLPPTLSFDPHRVDAFLRLLPRTSTDAARLARGHDAKVADRSWTSTDAERPLRHALEVRHPSFASAEAIGLLREHGVALVVADSAGRWPRLFEVTADFVYVRLHGADELYASGYTADALDEWAGRLVGWRDAGLDCYVYFDNDVKVHAPFDAQALRSRLAG